jgi:hypothetical protein
MKTEVIPRYVLQSPPLTAIESPGCPGRLPPYLQCSLNPQRSTEVAMLKAGDCGPQFHEIQKKKIRRPDSHGRRVALFSLRRSSWCRRRELIIGIARTALKTCWGARRRGIWSTSVALLGRIAWAWRSHWSVRRSRVARLRGVAFFRSPNIALLGCVN